MKFWKSTFSANIFCGTLVSHNSLLVLIIIATIHTSLPIWISSPITHANVCSKSVSVIVEPFFWNFPTDQTWKCEARWDNYRVSLHTSHFTFTFWKIKKCEGVKTFCEDSVKIFVLYFDPCTCMLDKNMQEKMEKILSKNSILPQKLWL